MNIQAETINEHSKMSSLQEKRDWGVGDDFSETGNSDDIVLTLQSGELIQVSNFLPF